MPQCGNCGENTFQGLCGWCDREATRIGQPNTDDASAEIVLSEVCRCAASWEHGVRLLGNVRATDIQRAAAAGAMALRRQQWQPIDTAPKDGTRVLVYACANRRHWFGTGYYLKGVPGDSEGWIAHSFCTTPKDDCSGSFEPTHWMPMLTPPEAA